MSRAWAKSIALALNQVWREGAARVRVARAGEDSHRTVRYSSFTRRQVLSMFSPDPSVFEVLDGSHPNRAREYWDHAISALKVEKLIGHVKQPALATRRQGWRDQWLDQPLDIRPAPDTVSAIDEIQRRSKEARQRLRR